MDVLEALRGEVDRAIAAGTTPREFQRALKPRLQTLGWWGEREMIDPRTGETRLVEIGPRRLRTIIDTNLRVAHARGRWERIERLAHRMPYLRYVATLDARTRPDHRAWHGTVLRADDSWWTAHYPPNGWRCRCTVVQLSEADLERRGWNVAKRAPPVRTRQWTNRRTGEVTNVPEGIDPGFQDNVGKVSRAAAAKLLLDGRIARADPRVRRAAEQLFRDPDGVALLGRRERERTEAAAQVTFAERGAPDFGGRANRFRAELIRRLQRERGAGRETARVVGDDPGVADRLKAASRLLPESWLRAVNAAGPVRVVRTDGRGGQYDAKTRTIGLPSDVERGEALHEYVHHMQYSIPGFQRAWRAEHLRRTTHPDGRRHQIEDVSGYPGDYRKDKYVDPYAGRVHPKGTTSTGGPDMPDGDAQEVVTTAFQQVFALGGSDLADMAIDDPRMLWGITDLLDVWGQAATFAILANSAGVFMPRERCLRRLL